MELRTEQLEDGITRISLAGRLDTPGTQEIDLQFTALTATQKAFIVVDLSQVIFLASIGIRTLLSNARALERRGGQMVLLDPQAQVHDVLKSAGVDGLIPLFFELEAARTALQASSGTA